MRLDDGRESSNVEDRRDEQGSGGGRGGLPFMGGKLGIGTIVVALVASYVLGMNQWMRKRALVVAALAMATAAGLAQAQTPLRLVVGFPPGATSDTMTRAIAEGMRPHFDRPIVVENRPGGGGLAALLFVRGQPADGAMLLMSPLGTLLQPH